MRSFISKMVATVAAVGLTLVPAWPAYADQNAEPDPAISSAIEPSREMNSTGLAIMNLSTPQAGDKFSVGEKITTEVRFESQLSTPVNIVGSSTTFTSANNCNWENFPAKEKGGKFSCKAGAQHFTEYPSYTVTKTDEEHGWVTLDFTFTAESLSNSSDKQSVTVKKTVPVYTAGEAEQIPKDSYPIVKLAQAGAANYTCHRIPALAKVQGRLIAAWDGRPNGCGDAPNPNSIIMKYSDDNGESWSDFSTIAQGSQGANKVGYSDPSFVVDEETGTIFAFFVKSFNTGIAHSQKGFDPDNRNIIHTVYVKSDDRGKTWSAPVLVTEQISKGQDQYARFAASGRGIQLKYGGHKGRLIQQYTVVNDGPWASGIHQAASLYSDDHGKTWQVGNPVGGNYGEQMDENKVVELSNGQVLLSSRRYEGESIGRHYALSDDGGHTYKIDKTNDKRLKDPRNNASIIRAFPDAPQNSERAKILLSSHSNSETHRINGIVSVSFDDGKTWEDAQTFKTGTLQYSTMEPLGNGKFGILYEGEQSEILYRTVDFAWLGLTDRLALLPDVEKAEQDLANKQHELEQTQQKLAQLNSELEKSKADNKALAQELAQVQAEVEKLKVEKAELEKKLAELQNKPKVEIPLVPLTPAQPNDKSDQNNSEPKIVIPAGDIVQGKTYIFSGTGFVPREKLKVTVHSNVVDLGSVTADEQGNFKLTWIVPADFAPGQHAITVTRTTGVVSESFVVVAKEVSKQDKAPKLQQKQIDPIIRHNESMLAKTGVGLGATVLVMVGMLALGGALSANSRRHFHN
ncbi:exo-alpha-sialidase [Arcanobacterium phocae]|uniref:exo-alpha-sialidase n=1 Tax=Arcanobacterium phocae TaxID=131112 RepID=UPI001C0EB6CF|nr:exo-alpha-sialidase [Arcanobacterium phocae]